MKTAVCSKYDQIILLSDTGMMKTAGIFIYNKAHAHMPPPDLLWRSTRQEIAYAPFKNTVYLKWYGS